MVERLLKGFMILFVAALWIQCGGPDNKGGKSLVSQQGGGSTVSPTSAEIEGMTAPAYDECMKKVYTFLQDQMKLGGVTEFHSKDPGCRLVGFIVKSTKSEPKGKVLERFYTGLVWDFKTKFGMTYDQYKEQKASGTFERDFPIPVGCDTVLPTLFFTDVTCGKYEIVACYQCEDGTFK